MEDIIEDYGSLIILSCYFLTGVVLCIYSIIKELLKQYFRNKNKYN